MDLVYCYTQEHKDKNAIKFLKGLAYSRGAYVAALEKLADRLGTLDAAAAPCSPGVNSLSSERTQTSALRWPYACDPKTKTSTRLAQTQVIARLPSTNPKAPGAAETRERLEAELETMIANLGILAQKSLNKLPKNSDARLRLARQISKAYELHVRTFLTVLNGQVSWLIWLMCR